MLGDWVQATTSTGGAGALTLSAVTGFPTFATVFGSVVRHVQYAVLEFTDSTLVTLSKAETGIGDLDGSTLILTRTKILSTWASATFDWTAPAAVSFGSTSANIRVTCAPLAGVVPLSSPWIATAATGGDAAGLPSYSISQLNSTILMVANQEWYVPHYWTGAGSLVSGSIGVTAAVAATHVKAALYELATTGLPGRKLFDIAAGTPFSSATTGLKTASLAQQLAPGWYYAGFLSDGAPTLKAAAEWYSSPAGGSAGSSISRLINASGNYATGLPATASGTLTASTANPPTLFLVGSA